MLSIYSNFAEGFERDGNREFSQFVSIAWGSVVENSWLFFLVDPAIWDAFDLPAGKATFRRRCMSNGCGKIRHCARGTT
jgi:hypothetical protein